MAQPCPGSGSLNKESMNAVVIPLEENCELRTWKDSEASALFALVDQNREYLGKWLPWVPFVKAEQDSLKFIQESQQSWEQQQSLELGIWQGQTLLGCIGLHALDTLHRKTSFGYWLGARYQGQGVMTRAVTGLVTYCFSERDFNRVEIRAAVGNTASRAIPERLGFTQEGILREAELIREQYLDIVVYSMLRSEWKNHSTDFS